MTEFIIIFVILWCFAIFLAPTAIAYNRKHKDVTAILALNLLLGWTFVGWVVALVWALKK